MPAEIKPKDGIMISSPFLIPQAFKTKSMPAVHDETAAQFLNLNIFLNIFSNFITFGPLINQLLFKQSEALRMSFKDKKCFDKGYIIYISYTFP